jgi:hypothetical protein
MIDKFALKFGAPVMQRRFAPCFRYRLDAVDTDKIALVEYEPPRRSYGDNTSAVPLAESRRLLICDCTHADDVQELCDKWNDQNAESDENEGEEVD